MVTATKSPAQKTARKYFGSGLSGLPLQTVSVAEKETMDWGMACMDFFDSVSGQQQQDKVRDLKKYKCLSPDYKAAEYQYVNVSSQTKEQQDEYGATEEIAHFPVMAQPINEIVGEYVKRPLNFYCVATSPRARNEYYRVKTDRLKNYAITKIQQRIMQGLIQQGFDPKQEDFADQVQAQMPADIQDSINKDYKDIAEQICQKLLNNLFKTESLDLEFLDGFKHAVITAKEFYHIYSVGSKTKIKCISPLEVFYHKFT